MDNVTFYNNIKSHLGEDGTKTHKWYGMGGAWCCMFVTKCFYEKDKSLWFGKQSYCPTAIKLCQTNLAQIPLYLAMPSDVIFFDWNANNVPDHIGFVRGRVSTDTINTIEGNTGSPSRVREKSRPAKYVLGIYRPHFKGTYDISKPLTVDGKFDYSSIAMLQKALGIKVDGILGKDTVKALQKKAKVTPDGALGKNTSKAVQKMVGTTADGQFGINSAKALQKWINKQVQFKTDGTKTETVKKEVVPTPSVPQPSKYGGEFPDWVELSGNIIATTARQLAYTEKYFNSNKSKCTWNKNRTTHATDAFMKAINKVYPKRSGWSKQCQDGASCDVGSGTVIRYCGADTDIPRGLDGQFPRMEKSKRFKDTGLKKSSQFKAGDVGMYMNKGSGAHIWISLGNGVLAEANHTSKYFFHIKTKSINNSSSRKKYYCFRMVVPIRTYMKKGDTGSEVTKLQKFLKWAGFDCGTADGDFGDRTLGAVKNFQLKVGLTADGEFGSKSLAKAKEYTK